MAANVLSLFLSIASGDGEKILQFCPSFHIVQKMREGYTPVQACESTVRTMKERSYEWFEVAVIALDTKVIIAATCSGIQELALDGNHVNGHVGLLYLVSGSTRAPGYVGVLDKHRLFCWSRYRVSCLPVSHS